MIIDFFKSIFSFGDTWIKWLNGRSSRVKDRALEAAGYYIELDQSSTYKGKFIGILEKDKLKKHFKKQFDAWRDGV